MNSKAKKGGGGGWVYEQDGTYKCIQESSLLQGHPIDDLKQLYNQKDVGMHYRISYCCYV